MWRELTQVTKEAGYVVCTLKKDRGIWGWIPRNCFCSSRMEGVQKNFDGEFTGGVESVPLVSSHTAKWATLPKFPGELERLEGEKNVHT